MEEISDTIKHLYQRKTAIQSVINGLENSVFFAEQGKLSINTFENFFKVEYNFLGRRGFFLLGLKT